MTTIFDGYDEEYRALTSDISKKLSEIASYEDQKVLAWFPSPVSHVGGSGALMDDFVYVLYQIQQMELEVRSLDAATRRELSKKVDQYKKSLASLSADHKRIREKEEREGLFGDRDGIALGRNREKIEATHSKVKGVNEMARRGGNIVGRMSARDKRQRLALSIAAGFIIIAILLLIYFGIFKKK
ncbi:hypothetical protein BBJ28_00009948 [Nothophytophthora sp. Chile5]|nr:hypothetical protein BBJ28_00009948 [Nothophytophthora sp. Chile5]